MSTGISAPSAPGARSPARSQARSRAAARASRIARSARGASAARAVTSRDTTGSDATGQASSGWERNTAMSARQSPPSASAMTRSAMIFPGSCTARGARHRASPAVRAPPRPVTRAASASSNAPAWETRPRPSADTVILGRRAVLFTWKVPSVWCGQDPRQIPSSQAKALFICKRSRPADRRRKPEASSSSGRWPGAWSASTSAALVRASSALRPHSAEKTIQSRWSSPRSVSLVAGSEQSA